VDKRERKVLIPKARKGGPAKGGRKGTLLKKKGGGEEEFAGEKKKKRGKSSGLLLQKKERSSDQDSNKKGAQYDHSKLRHAPDTKKREHIGWGLNESAAKREKPLALGEVPPRARDVLWGEKDPDGPAREKNTPYL